MALAEAPLPPKMFGNWELHGSPTVTDEGGGGVGGGGGGDGGSPPPTVGVAGAEPPPQPIQVNISKGSRNAKIFVNRTRWKRTKVTDLPRKF